MVCVGNPLNDGLRQVISTMPPVSELLKGAGLSRDQLRRALRGYALVSAQTDGDELMPADLPKIARVARDLGRETLVVWLVTDNDGAGHPHAAKPTHCCRNRASWLCRVRATRCSLACCAAPLASSRARTGSWSKRPTCWTFRASCCIPAVMCLPGPPGGVIARIACDSSACVRALHEILERGRADDDSSDVHDGSPTQRVAEHLRGWLVRPKRQRNDSFSDAAA